MSVTKHNRRIAEAVRADELPGRSDDEGLDQRRGYVGWGPHEDATCDEGKTVEHQDWNTYLGATANTGRLVLDYYFDVERDKEDCPSCDASGHTKEYAELERGFYRFGGGRWSGWGEGRLTQEEIDALVQKKRITPKRGEAITPDNLRHYLGRIGHDAINRWILVEIRAKNMGFDRTCDDCHGQGWHPTSPDRIRLNIWTASPEEGTTRCDTIRSVRPEELGEVKDHLRELGLDVLRRNFGWATGDNMHPEIRYEADWIPGKGGMRMGGGWWTEGMRYTTWAAFTNAFGIEGDPDLNLVVDYQIIVAEEHRATPMADTNLPEVFEMRVWMTHPRKGADRAIVIEQVPREKGPEIKAWLARSAAVHERHFGWVSGSYPDPDPDSLSGRLASFG